jgi:molybdenum cofactor cytidylyltransferase
LVVSGYRADELEAALAGLGAYFARNPGWERGMLGSIALGARRARELDPGGLGFLVSHADMPLVPPTAFALLIAEAERLSLRRAGSDAPQAVFSRAQGRLGHPVWLSYALTERLASWDPGASLKAYLQEGRWEACELDDALGASVAGLFIDLDTPEAYEQALAGLVR